MAQVGHDKGRDLLRFWLPERRTEATGHTVVTADPSERGVCSSFFSWLAMWHLVHRQERPSFWNFQTGIIISRSLPSAPTNKGIRREETVSEVVSTMRSIVLSTV